MKFIRYRGEWYRLSQEDLTRFSFVERELGQLFVVKVDSQENLYVIMNPKKIRVAYAKVTTGQLLVAFKYSRE